jgi:hypothetical protein
MHAVGLHEITNFPITLTAPPPPRRVTAELVTPVVVKVTWSRPVAVRGVLVFYTVYASPFVSQVSPPARSKRQIDNNPLRTITKVISALINIIT